MGFDFGIAFIPGVIATDHATAPGLEHQVVLTKASFQASNISLSMKLRVCQSICVLRELQSQKLLLVWKCTCTNKIRNFVKETYTSGYFVFTELFLHLKQINLHPNIQFFSSQQHAYQSFSDYILV